MRLRSASEMALLHVRCETPLLLILRQGDGLEEVLDGRGAWRPVDQLAVLANDGDGALDARAGVAEGIVGPGDVQALIDQEVEVQLLLVYESLVAGGVRFID